MYLKFVLIGLLILTVSCKKDNESILQNKPVTELLTQKEWILTSTGFDDNKNGILDPEENTIQDCHKDNSYIFDIAGTGSVYDNLLSCGGSPSYHFSWKLLNNNTGLEVGFEQMIIFKLNENEMILSPDLPGLAVKFIMVYRH